MQEPRIEPMRSQPARRTVKLPRPSSLQLSTPIEMQAHVATMQVFNERVQAKIKVAQCALHHQVAIVTLVVTDDFFEYHLEACCDRLADDTVAQFRSVFSGEKSQDSAISCPGASNSTHTSETQDQRSSAICDACGNPTMFAESYSLTSREVLLTTSYWVNAFRGSLSHLHAQNPTGGTLLMMAVEHLAGQGTGWLLCESCASPLQFDRHRARRFAELQQSPEGAGSLSPREVAPVAVNAWTQVYGNAPQLTEFSDVLVTTRRPWWKFWNSNKVA